MAIAPKVIFGTLKQNKLYYREINTFWYIDYLLAQIIIYVEDILI